MIAVATWFVFLAGVEVGACVGLFVAGLLNTAAMRRWKRERDQ